MMTFYIRSRIMAEHTAIEWTDATWNPVTGCDKISPGCLNCYAERFSERFRGVPGHPFEQGFDLRLRPERLEQPLKWKSPRRIFVNSMSDLFHKDVPDDFIGRVFDVMEHANQHVFQVLTKRSSRMAGFTRRRYGKASPPPNIWLGVSVEDGRRKGRISHLRQTVASVRFLSVEPLIGPMGEMDLTDIDWVIVGGESGPGHRPMRPEWVDEVQEQCADQAVPFFFKQWGGIRPKANGRLLKGREWNEFPRERDRIAA
jgi:protein gp37